MGERFKTMFAVLTAGACLAACGKHDAPVRRPAGFTQYQAVPRASTADSVEFTDVSGIDVDSRGNLYVADLVDVTVLSPEARPLRRIGREGKGPGEFEHVSSVRVLPGDSLYTFDGGASRVTVFGPSTDRPAYTVSMSTAGLYFPYEVERVPHGRLLAVYRAAYGAPRAPGQYGQRLETVRLLNPDASVRQDSVLSFPEYEAIQIDNGPIRGALFTPWGRRMLVAVHGDRIYSAWSGDWQVDVHSAEGKRLASIRPSGSPPPRPITRGEMDSVITETMKGLPFSRGIVQRAMEGAGTRTWPLLQDLLVDDAGVVWLGVTGQRGEGTHWLGVDERGNRVAAFDVPDRVRIHLIRGTTAYGVRLDDDDAPHVVIYDLKPIHTRTQERT